MYRTIATTLALLLILIFSSHGQANANIVVEAPHAISAKSIPGNQISISFDRQLNNSELRSWYFHIHTPNIHIIEARVQGDKVILLLTQSIQKESYVFLTIDSGAVRTYESESENEAVSYLRVTTPASALYLKNTLDPNKTGFSVQHIIKYITSSDPQSVYGTSAFNHEDISYLLSRVEGVNPDKSILNDYYTESSYILSSTPNYPFFQFRDALSNAVSAAQAVLSQSSANQRQVDDAVMTLMNAQQAYLSAPYNFLNTDQSDPDFEIIGNMIYVPFGMSVETLIDKLTPAVEIYANADNSTLVTSGKLTGAMKVVILNIPSQIYHIKIQASVSNMEELQSALADSSVSIIKLKANITSLEEDILIDHDIHFSATEPITISVGNIILTASYSWDNKITFLKNVLSEADLLVALNSEGDKIEVLNPIDEFTGLLERVRSGNTSYFRSEDHKRAFVSYADQLQGALLDAEVENIYIAQDIYVQDTLTFPERTFVLSGPTSPKSTLTATRIANTLTGYSGAIHIVNETATQVAERRWGNYYALGYLGQDDARLSWKFSSALEEDARESVEQALIAGASNDDEGVSVIDATYLEFIWSNNYFALDVRNTTADPIYFPEDIYAELSNEPYSIIRILDQTLFLASIYIEGNNLEVEFNQDLANTTLSLDTDQIILSLSFISESNESRPITYTSARWEDSRILIELDDEQIDYNNGGLIELIFKHGSIKNEEGERIYNVRSSVSVVN